MPRVHFTKTFAWHTPGTNTMQTTRYKAGTTRLVTTVCAAAAIAAGAAEAVKVTRRKGKSDAGRNAS